MFYELESNSDKVIAYNAMTNALALMSKEKYQEFLNTNINDLDKDKEFFNKLVSGGYLINDDFDELSHLSFNLLKDRYSTRGLGLTIAPTIDCNFDCIYCYQKEGQDSLYMKKDVQDKIIEFVKEKVNHIESLSVTWYGGEPLLSMDAIEYISKNLIDICTEHNISYFATMVTNGYNLTKDTAKKLKDLKVDNLQVTIDGVEEIHDQRRPLVGGQGTFKRILNNLKACSDICENMSLRVNVDKDNMYKTKELLEYLREYGITKSSGVYIAKVDNANECYDKKLCLETINFCDLKSDVNNSLVEIDGYPETINYPNLITNSCLADSLNGFLIDPKGNIYKCWNDIGFEERVVGSLMENTTVKFNRALFDEYMLYDATKDLECSNCNILPICMGGCPRRRVEKENRCSDFKYNIEKKLQWMAKKLEYKSEEKHKCKC